MAMGSRQMGSMGVCALGSMLVVCASGCFGHHTSSVSAAQKSNMDQAQPVTAVFPWSGPKTSLIQAGPGHSAQFLVNSTKINPIYLSLNGQAIGDPGQEANWAPFVYELNLALTYGTPVLDVMLGNHSPA